MKPINYFVTRQDTTFRVYISSDTHGRIYVQIFGQKAIPNNTGYRDIIKAYHIEAETLLREKRDSSSAAHIQWWIERNISELMEEQSKPKNKSKKVKS